MDNELLKTISNMTNEQLEQSTKVLQEMLKKIEDAKVGK